MLERLKTVANSLKQEIKFYRLVIKDNRTPRIAKIILGIAIGYIFLPFDLIPDWIPVIGYLDDLIVVPILVIVALKFIPHEVKRECRKNLQ